MIVHNFFFNPKFIFSLMTVLFILMIVCFALEKLVAYRNEKYPRICGFIFAGILINYMIIYAFIASCTNMIRAWE